MCRALAAAGLAALWLAGAARRAAAKFRIPGKPFRAERLRDPHDLAG
jgi:hypothetical protein